MNSTIYTYLKFTRFKDILFWDIKRYQNESVKSKYSLVALSSLIVEEKTKFDISNPLQQYGILGVNNKTGIFDAYIENGANIKQKYKRMETGWIAYNPYRINVGSIGIKQDYHKHEFISPAYVVFRCGPRLLPEFLYLVMRSNRFNSIIKENTTGSVRQTLSFQSLSRLNIPLPTIHEQEKLISEYNTKIQQIKELGQRVDQIEEDIEVYITNMLGLKTAQEKEDNNGNYLRFVHLDELAERWDVWNITNANYTGRFPLVKLSQIITLSSGKFLPTRAQVPGKYNVYGGNGLTGTHNKFCYSGKRIVIGRVGEYCGNVHLIDGEYWITDNALKVDKIRDDVLWEYLELALQVLNINQYRSISAQPSISQKKILQLQIPLPPFAVQQEIATHFSEYEQERKRLLSEAERYRYQALQQFEQTIYNQINNKNVTP